METALSGGIVDDDDGSVEIFEARVETSPQIVSLSDTQSSISTPDTLGRERAMEEQFCWFLSPDDVKKLHYNVIFIWLLKLIRFPKVILCIPRTSY